MSKQAVVCFMQNNNLYEYNARSVANSPLLILPDRLEYQFQLKNSKEVLTGTFIGHDFIHYPDNLNDHPIYYSYKDVNTFYNKETVSLLNQLDQILKIAKDDTNTPVTCIYHAGCSDGLMSAAIVKHYFKNHEVNFVEGRHGETVDPNNYKGHFILMVDFSYETNLMSQLAEVSKEFVIFDHHKTTMERIQDDYDNLTQFLSKSYIVIADMMSGCGLTWYMLFKDVYNRVMPQPVQYIQDGDLWTWIIPDSKIILPAIYFNTSKTIDSYYKLLTESFNKEWYLEVGRILSQQKTNHVKDIVKATYQTVVFDGKTIGIANCNYMYASEVGHYIIENYPVDYSFVYRLTSDGVKISLRSDDHLADVSYIAQKHFNGGGHRNASGGCISFEQFYDIILKNIQGTK